MLQQPRRAGHSDYAKDRINSLGCRDPGKVRINMAGCLDRCDEGPVMVIYPEEVLVLCRPRRRRTIIHEHLTHGRVVKRLKIPFQNQEH